VYYYKSILLGEAGDQSILNLTKFIRNNIIMYISKLIYYKNYLYNYMC
jgi:hypothetical protein